MKHATGILFLLCLFSLFSIVPVSGQVSIFLTDATVQPGETFTVPVKAANYQSILSTQFFIRWDPTVLSFKNVVDLHPPFDFVDHFGALSAQTQGTLAFAWFDTGSLSGINIENDSSLFSIEFTAVGSYGEYSKIEFYEDPSDASTITEIVDTSYKAIPYEVIDATISLGETVSTLFNSAPDKILIKPCYPNPFTHHTTLNFKLTQATTIHLNILDLQGKTVFEEQRYFGSGQHQLTLEKDVFGQPGIYFYHLTSPSFKVTQRLVFLEQ